MNEIHFKSGMGLMQKLFGHKLDPDIYKFYWNTFQYIGDDEWRITMENVICNFIPSNQVPFPPIAFFKKNIPEKFSDCAPRYGIEYKRPTHTDYCKGDEIEEWIDSLPEKIRPKKNRFRNDKIEKLGDILNN